MANCCVAKQSAKSTPSYPTRSKPSPKELFCCQLCCQQQSCHGWRGWWWWWWWCWPRPHSTAPFFPPTCDIFALKLELLTRSFCVDCPYPATLVWVFGWKTNRRRRWEYEVLHNLYLLFTLFFSCLCHVFSTPSCWFFSDAYLLIKLSF